MASLNQRKQAREINVNPEISILALVSFPGTSRRLGSHVARRLFDGSFWLDQTVLISQQRNAESRAALEQGGLRAGSTKLLLHLSSMEGGLCSNLFELASGNKGAWPAPSVSRAMRATPSKSRTWADMPPTFLRARGRKLCRQPDRSSRSDRLFQTLLFWILRVCAARSH